MPPSGGRSYQRKEILNNRQSQKFGDSQAGMEQNVHRIVIHAVTPVLFDKGEKLSHLVSADGFPCVGIVDNDLTVKT